MEYLRIRNWEKFQHYKDRNPPWIKLHRDLLRDYEFSCLQDASKLHLMLLWLLASQLDNKIPADEKWLTSHLGLQRPIVLKPLIDNGYIEYASKPLADCKQSAIVETETEAYKQETETETEPSMESFGYLSKDLWADFIKHRKEIKKPLKPTSEKALLTKLKKWHDKGIDVNECVSASIENGWQGVFEPDAKRMNGGVKPSRLELADAKTKKVLDEIKQRELANETRTIEHTL